MRVAGTVELIALTSSGEDGTAPDRRIKADLSGDITSLIVPEYHDFFGPDVGLSTTTVLENDGRIDVQAFDITARSVELSGNVVLNSDLWPEFIDVEGEISQDG